MIGNEVIVDIDGADTTDIDAVLSSVGDLFDDLRTGRAQDAGSRRIHSDTQPS